MKLYKVPYGIDVSVEFKLVDSLDVHGLPCQAKQAIVHSPMYKTTKHVLDVTWSDAFLDEEIIQDEDFKSILVKMFGNE